MTTTDAGPAFHFGETFRGAAITLEALPMGEDLAIALSGGERPHIGAVAVAQPHPGLDDPDRTSATASTIALVGHREDMLARGLANRIAAATGRVVALACGIHYDDLSAEEIDAVTATAGRLVDRLLLALRREAHR